MLEVFADITQVILVLITGVMFKKGLKDKNEKFIKYGISCFIVVGILIIFKRVFL